MFKRIFIILIFLLNLTLLNAASVDVNVEISEDESVFTYFFNFNENDSYRSFSFEKLPDARVNFARDKDGLNVRYSVAGDYIILQPSSSRGEEFVVQYTSKSASKNILDDKYFSIYVNFNFIVDKLQLKILFNDDMGDIVSYFPRNYEVSEYGTLHWDMENVESDELFRLEFFNPDEKYGFFEILVNNWIWILFSIFILALFVIFTIFVFVRQNIILNNFLKKKDKKIDDNVRAEKDSKEAVSEERKAEMRDDESVLDNDQVEKENKESFDEFVAKFLTDNEKEVVKIVKEHEGLAQYDILNFLPSLSKSNLSKIISKLDNKAVLKRIRVGKVNKIYLGDKLKNE